MARPHPVSPVESTSSLRNRSSERARLGQAHLEEEGAVMPSLPATQPLHIGILGAGKLGGTLGTLWARRGHAVCFSFSRDAQKLAALARTAGPTARWGTPANAVDFGEVVLLAVPWAVVNDALGA